VEFVRATDFHEETDMPGQVGPIGNEQEGLLAFLAQARYLLRLTAYGLSDEQLRATPSASPLSVGGLVKHCASTEEGWLSTIRNEPQVVDYEAYGRNFALQTEKTVAEIGDLGHRIPIDHSVPWNRKDLEYFTVRWILLHLIQETARHTGHADIVRETVDGATAFPLLAAAEGWPETPWLKPWQPT
jgi:uncharacterized damage-inducible protein DinB